MNTPLAIETHTVPPQGDKTRLSDYAVGIFNTITTRKGVKKAILKKLVKVNGKNGLTSDFIIGGETIELYSPNKPFNQPIVTIELTVLYEDDYLAIVYKPPGILVSGNKKWTLQNALIPHLIKSTHPDALHCPEPIHRLDYPTSGALLVGKTAKSVIELNTLFEHKQISKTYLAVCIGKMKPFGSINTPIDNKDSISEFEVLETVTSPKFGFLNLVQLNPKTGRRHQLRKHLDSIGNPILGDLQYGKEGLLLKGKGLYLHAYRLSFTHPNTKQLITAEAPIPKKFKKLFNYFT